MARVYPDLSLTLPRLLLDNIDLCLNLNHRDWIFRGQEKHNGLLSIDKIGDYMQGKFKPFKAEQSSGLSQSNHPKNKLSYDTPGKKEYINMSDSFSNNNNKNKDQNNVGHTLFDDSGKNGNEFSQNSRISNLFKKYIPAVQNLKKTGNQSSLTK
jgi:hypothetical protein